MELQTNGIDKPSREFSLSKIDSSTLRFYLMFILKDELTLRMVASNSYTHQLGFEKLLLSPSNFDSIWIRVHFWPCSLSGRDTDIHSHCASFSSVILTGELSSLTYERSETGDKFYEYEYLFDSKRGKSSSLFKHSIRLRPGNKQKLISGSVYSLPANALHQTIDIAENTVTLSIWERRNQTASVFKRTPVSDGSDTRKAGMSLKYARAKLQQIIDKLGS